MIPDSITNPIIAITLIRLPDTKSPRNPPVNARGTVNMTINGERSDWNWATMIRYMNTTARASIFISSTMVSRMVSSSPVIWIV